MDPTQLESELIGLVNIRHQMIISRCRWAMLVRISGSAGHDTCDNEYKFICKNQSNCIENNRYELITLKSIINSILRILKS